MQAQEDRQLSAQGAQAAIQTAQRRQEETHENPQFLNELRKADIDSELFDWLEDEYPSWFSGAHSVTNRGPDWGLQADLMLKNKRERAFAQANPGRLLRDRPVLLAIAQGKTDTAEPKPQKPMTSEERRATYAAAEVAADLWALSTDKAGLEATSTATTETKVTRTAEEEGSTKKKVASLYE